MLKIMENNILDWSFNVFEDSERFNPDNLSPNKREIFDLVFNRESSTRDVETNVNINEIEYIIKKELIPSEITVTFRLNETRLYRLSKYLAEGLIKSTPLTPEITSRWLMHIISKLRDHEDKPMNETIEQFYSMENKPIYNAIIDTNLKRFKEPDEMESGYTKIYEVYGINCVLDNLTENEVRNIDKDHKLKLIRRIKDGEKNKLFDICLGEEISLIFKAIEKDKVYIKGNLFKSLSECLTIWSNLFYTYKREANVIKDKCLKLEKILRSGYKIEVYNGSLIDWKVDTHTKILRIPKLSQSRFAPLYRCVNSEGKEVLQSLTYCYVCLIDSELDFNLATYYGIIQDCNFQKWKSIKYPDKIALPDEINQVLTALYASCYTFKYSLEEFKQLEIRGKTLTIVFSVISVIGLGLSLYNTISTRK